jgi:ribose transport system substrate-binding protein
MKKSLLVCFIIFTILTLIACSSTTNQKNSLHIGVVLSSEDTLFFQDLKKGIEETALEFKYKTTFYNSTNDLSNELKHIKTAIDQKVDYLIINPTDSDSVFEGIMLANNANIPVITLDRSSNGGRILCHIASDNFTGGELAATYLMSQFSEDVKVAELKGIKGTSATIDRGNGFNSMLKNASNLILVASETADFDREKAFEITKLILDTHPDLDAIFAHNDEMALGAVDAAELLNKEIFVIGFDGIDAAIESINLGKLNMTVAQQPILMGKKSVDIITSMTEKKEVPKIVFIELKVITLNE